MAFETKNLRLTGLSDPGPQVLDSEFPSKHYLTSRGIRSILVNLSQCRTIHGNGSPL